MGCGSFSQVLKQGWCWCRHVRMHSKWASELWAWAVAQGLKHAMRVWTQPSLHASKGGCAKARAGSDDASNTTLQTIKPLSVQSACCLGRHLLQRQPLERNVYFFHAYENIGTQSSQHFFTVLRQMG